MYAPIIALNSSRYNNQLKMLKFAQKSKDCTFLCVGQNTEDCILSLFRKQSQQK